MAAKRIFISFAIEDRAYRDLLKGQAINEQSPFEFIDMSVKKPWDSAWKTKCRERIKGCSGVIALVSKNTAKADGQLWELNCAKEESKPIRGIYTNADDKPATLPSVFQGIRVVNWTWENIKKYLDSL